MKYCQLLTGCILETWCKNPNVKGNQSHYRPEVPGGFQEVKVPIFRDNGTGWW